MPDVSFKDLCLDACRPELVGAFWGELLDQQVLAQDNGDVQLEGVPVGRTIWVNGVPEQSAVKSRVHLDVRLAASDTPVPQASLVAPASEDTPWRVLADPDGLVFCAFGPREGATEGPFELVVDAVDPVAQATWWAARTGGTVHQREGLTWAWIEGAAGFPYLFWVFGRVPEPKTTKNRMHWDVTLADATVADLLELGCRVVDVRPGWTVLADPEGNEFCAF